MLATPCTIFHKYIGKLVEHKMVISSWLTSPSQLLMATVAPRISVIIPVYTQLAWIESWEISWKSSCHWIVASWETSLLLGFKRRCSCLPKTVTLKYKHLSSEWVIGGSGILRANLCPGCFKVILLPAADTTWEIYRPRWSVLNGTTTPYSLSFPERCSIGNR